ncbi:MAG: metal-dependent hydrolase [Deltaproteobacteria bacterium]|nr:metal-dependent hydrolase [Deltaproteobacteria bacterium]
MASYQNHISFSAAIGAAYAVGGVFFFNIYPELTVLALALIIICGLIPDVDANNGAPSRELGALLATVTPVVIIEFFPGFKAGGIARIALLAIGSYLFTRIVVVRALQKFTDHRGMLHSMPAAVIFFELAYLLFWDLYWKERLYIASAAFLGFFSHLLLDALGNVDIVGSALGKAEKKKAVLKFVGDNLGITLFMYASVLLLGWFVFKDVYPELRNYARL